MPGQVNLDELKVIGHILMGAASADGKVDGDEAETIMAIMAEMLGDRELPDLKPHLRAFSPASFDLSAAAKQLHLAGASDRRALLQLVARVTDADDVHDLREDDYIRAVATAIGAEASEYESLTVELTFISSLEPPALPAG